MTFPAEGQSGSDLRAGAAAYPFAVRKVLEFASLVENGRLAIAMPTLVATPWPSGPVVVSTPVVK